MTAMGYDFVPGALAGALALEEGGEDAVRVDVGYYALGAAPERRASARAPRSSAPRSTTATRSATASCRIVRTAERVRNFTVKDKERAAVSVGGAEHLGLPASYPRLREVNVYLGWFGPLARPMQAGALVGSVATRLPGVREALEFAGEKLVALGRGPRGRARRPAAMSWVAARGLRRRRRAARRGPPRGRQLVRVHRRLHRLGGARRAAGRVKGTGALGPVEAFGLAELERGCAAAGLSRAAA